MSSPENALDDLRREVDEIDDSIHDLIMRRAGMVEKIAAAKGRERVYLRPAREAKILRRLAARHTGRFPFAVLVRMWRELLAGTTRLQGPFAIAVCSREGDDLWDVARDHYGSTTPIVPVNAPMAAIRLVMDGAATVAVVPWPEDSDPDPWWPALMAEDGKSPRIVSRLPFLRAEKGDERPALAIAQLPYEPTGDDHTLIGIETAGDLSRGRLKDAAEAAGLVPLSFWNTKVGGESGTPLQLLEVDDFVGAEDGRLERLVDKIGDTAQRAVTIGGFATPMPAQMPTRGG